MGFAAGDLILDKHFGPARVEHRLVGIFKEALVDEVRPGPAPMDPVLIFAAFFGNRCGPAS
jgi:hypothetical protein